MGTTITPSDLVALQNLTFQRPSLSRLLSRTGSSQSRFHLHLLALEAPSAIAYDRLLSNYCDPTGIECRHRSGCERWAFVITDVSSQTPSTWRVQYFDRDGFQSHHCEPTMLDAVNCMISDGFINPTPGVLDQISQTPRWKRGVEVAALMFQLNTRAITYVQFTELVAALEPA